MCQYESNETLKNVPITEKAGMSVSDPVLNNTIQGECYWLLIKKIKNDFNEIGDQFVAQGRLKLFF